MKRPNGVFDCYTNYLDSSLRGECLLIVIGHQRVTGMFKIGDFSKLSRVSIKALRLYDQIGLLKPAHVDNFTSYRYYTADQLPRLNRILAFKDLGFSLEQIALLLNDPILVSQIRGMLLLKQAELQQLVEVEQAKLTRIEVRIKQIEKENTMPNYEAIVKAVEPVQVVSIRDTLPTYFSVGRLFDELEDYLRHQGAKTHDNNYCAAIWHDTGYKDRDVDGEAVLSIDSLVSENERVKVYELPGFETMACVIHHGSYSTINLAYSALLDWISNNDYKIVSSNREFYIHGGREHNNEAYVTELQFPVAKV